MNYNRVARFIPKIYICAGLFPDNAMQVGRGLGLELGLDLGFMAFYAKYLLISYWNHSPYTLEFSFSTLYPTCCIACLA